MSDRAPGPGEQYCPNCRAVVSRQASMCPECNSFAVEEVGDPAGSSRSGRGGRTTGTGRGGPRADPEATRSGEATATAGTDPGEFLPDLDAGGRYAAAGAVCLVLSVLTFVGSFFLTFSLLVGVFVLPLSALFGVTGTLLGVYSFVVHRSRFGGGVALVGTVEALVVLGSVALALLVFLGVVAAGTPTRVLILFARLLEWLWDQLFGTILALLAAH